MKGLSLASGGQALSVLCLGAHSDDIEIGAGGTILGLLAGERRLRIHWCVASAHGARRREAEASAMAFLEGAFDCSLELGDFDDSHFPAQSRAIKEWLVAIRARAAPDIVLTHARDDAHQDHRLINEITWNLFRDHLILEYEVPKWDGDLSRRNFYVPLPSEIMERKIALLANYFASQRAKDWFDAETFRGLARLRGMECRAPERYAEAFTLRKGWLVL